MIRAACWCLLLMMLVAPATATTYYVDAQHGDNRSEGVSTDKAWKSLEPVNTTPFKPGDHILLRAGDQYQGQIAPKGSGTDQQAIEFGRWGEGTDPRIDGQGKLLDTLLLTNVEHWDVHHLEITNHGEAPVAFRTGVRVESSEGGILHGIHLSHLFVHDVNGDLSKEKEGCGIFFDSRGKSSCYDDLVIEDCHVADTDRNGICQRTLSKGRSTHVIIRNNLLENIGGDGIKLWGSNGGLIEHNVLRGGRMRCDDYAAGIWPFACDDTLIQYNEVSGMKGIKDGQGFDSDYICRNSIYQYNYSHDNDGGFILICSPGWSYCRGTIIRYNISQNDGQTKSSIFHFAGNSSDTLVHNNVIYLSTKQNVPLLKYDEWDKGNAHHTAFVNNIFYADGQATYSWGKSVDNSFDHNAFAGHHIARPQDPHEILAGLPLLGIGSGKDGFASLAGYSWVKGRAVSLGIATSDHCDSDFFGHPLPRNGAPSIGVAQP